MAHGLKPVSKGTEVFAVPSFWDIYIAISKADGFVSIKE
jgi:hypothetical protein